MLGIHHQTDGCFKTLRPGRDGAQRSGRPIERTDEFPHLTATFEESELVRIHFADGNCKPVVTVVLPAVVFRFHFADVKPAYAGCADGFEFQSDGNDRGQRMDFLRRAGAG